MALTSQYSNAQLLAAAQLFLNQNPVYQKTGWTVQSVIDDALSGKDKTMYNAINTLAAKVPATPAPVDPLTTFYNNLHAATTQQQIDDLVAQANTAGLGYDQQQVKNISATLPANIAAATIQQAAAKK